jgi:hypothetical protein
MKKHFIIDTAVCMCKFGTVTGLLKVISHNLMVLNHSNSKIATTMELGSPFYPPMFGVCKANWPPRPCVPNIIKWSNPFKKMRLQGNAYPLMPDSKATCAMCGAECIDIMFHGQLEIPGPLHIQNATAEHQSELDPTSNLSQEEDYNITVQQITL